MGLKVSPLVSGIAATAVHRIDAWGVALIVCGVALWVHDSVSVKTLLLALAITWTYGLGYAVNDYFDAPFDALDDTKRRHNLFVRHPISGPRAALAFAGIACVPLLSFASFGLRGVVLFGICMFVIWSYSAPPLRLKSRPGLDLLTHALFVQTFAYLICLLLIDARWTALDALLLGVNFLASLSGQLSQQIRDFDLDARTEANFSIRVGREVAMSCRRAATGVLVALVSAGLVAGIVPLLLVPIALTFAPATLHRLASPQPLRAAHAVVLPTVVSLVYTGLLLCTRLLA